MVFEQIKPLSIGALISIDHPLAQQDQLSGLQNIPMVSLSPESSPAYYRMVQNICRMNHITPDSYCFVEDFEDLLLNIETRMTLGIMAGNNGIRAKSEIRTIPLEGSDKYYELVCWDKTNKNPVIQSLIDIMKKTK